MEKCSGRIEPLLARVGRLVSIPHFAVSCGLAFTLLIGACSSAPRYHHTPAEGPLPTSERSEIIQEAKSFLGTPYKNGGTSRNGVDCSGFVVAVYRQFNIALPRTSQAQSTTGSTVDRSKLEPGDLVFFKTSRKRVISHVGIYIGKGQFIHASTRSRQVRIDHLDEPYFKKRFVVAKRIVD
jgi:cell wall-associated NlpC family hydrolase